MQGIKPISINKADRLPDMDFELLRQKGLEYLQQLTGQKWTDFNAHDPGITILEQLCYAITDLAYRIEYPVQDLLKTAYHQPEANNALYPLLHIISTKPITINDFRRIIIDRIPEVENAWIESVSMIPGKRSLNGHYTVLLQTNKKTEAEIKREPTIRDGIVDKVVKLLNSERNLCEVFREVRILQPKEVMVNAKVLINPKANAEEILAAIYNAVETQLSGQVSFYTLQELLAKGVPLNDIVTGPKLHNGFMLEQDLRPRARQVSISTINKVIMSVEGVEHVKNLSVSEGAGQPGKDLLLLEEREYPLLDTSYLNSKDHFSIQVFKENFEYPVDRQRVENNLRELRAVSHRTYTLSERSHEYLQIAPSEYQELDVYSSIQNDFPKVYMIDKEGLPTSAPALRKAQANQLKTYLLFFEQILANYFVQLQSTGEFFSIDVDNVAPKTYFSQPLYQVPDVHRMIKSFEQKSLIKENRGQLSDRWEEFADLDSNPYSQFLDSSLESREEYLARKNRVLDHLLARFGEHIDDYSISSYRAHYGNESTEPLEQSLKLKAKFLQQYVSLGYNRASAANTDAPFGSLESISGLERRVALLLGFSDERRKLAVMPGNGKEKIKLESTKKKDDPTTESHTWGDDKVDIVLDDGLEKLVVDKDTSPTGSFVFKGPKDKVIKETLYHGIDSKNFKIGPLEIKGEKRQAIIFKKPEDAQWQLISLHNKPADAVAAIKKLTGYLTQQSIQSEGFYLIEHTLLQSGLEDSKFGFSLVNRRGEAFLSNYKPMRYYDRYQHAQDVLRYGAMRENYYMDRINAQEFRVVIHNDQDVPIASSTKSFPIITYGGPEAERYTKRMMRNIAFLNKHPERSLAQMRLYTHLDENTQVPEEFYSFNATVVLPAWPARFQDAGFRKHLQNTFRAFAPAHIRLNFKWLEFTAMEKFEQTYEDWLAEKAAAVSGGEHNEQLIELLKR
ncbi:hypothetical protein BH09BAC1_BH09BAC1_10960 [soil metagenome]